MEIKKIFAALSAAALILSAAVIGYAADDVIFESGKTEATGTAVDLDGWGEELFTRAIFEADVQFKDVDSGITLRNGDNTKGGTSIRAVMRNDVLTMAAYGGVEGNYIYYNPIDTEAIYHIKLIGTYGTSNGMIDMVADKLDENGNAVETKNAYLILMNEMYASSNVGPEHIRVEANTVVDNVKVTVLKPDSLEFVTLPETITAGSKIELGARFMREGEELEYAAPITYTADGEGIAVFADGIKVDANAPEQEFTITAASGDMTATAKMQVVSSDIFTINTALISEDGKTLEAVNAIKNYFYNGNAVFVVTAYDENGILHDAFVKSVNAKAIPTKTDTDIILGYTLPEAFNADTWTIEINAWSASDTCDVPNADGEYIPVRAFFEENGGAVEWIGEHKTVVGMLNGKTAVMQTDNSSVFVDGEKTELANAPYISDDWSTYAGSSLAELFR